jgi:hypothetical protein
MLYAYFWACRLSEEELPRSLQDVETRAILIDKIDMPLTLENNTANLLLEHMSPDEREFRIKKVLGIGNSFLLDQISETSKKNIILRLWSGCLDAAKSIAVQSRDGLTSPEIRKEHFFQIDLFASWDLIYRAGVESAPPFKRRRKESYKFEGVPNDSPVRRYPNEYLL